MNTKSKNSKNKKLLTSTRVNKFDGEKDTSSGGVPPGSAPGSVNVNTQSGGSSTLSKGQIASGTASAAAGALNLVSGALGSANKIDTSKADNAIAAVNSFQPQASSMDSLANQLNSFEDASTDWKGSDFGMSTKEGLTSLGTSMATGAAAGAAFGPWGALAGAAAGLTAAGAGWVANAVKSKAKAEELNRKAEAANYNAKQRSLLAVENFKDDQMNDFMSNIAANGGKIHIKPSKRGTFTAAAKQRGLGVQEFASKVLANKENYSTAMVRKANFAKNASKWHHAYGGPLYNHTGDWSNGLTFINEGGTHEENPFDGVLMGFDQEGVPNLVEEGEIIYNDYVFSNRLKPSKKQLESTGLNSKYNNWTFAKIVEDLQKSSAETPLDKISKDSLDDTMNTIMALQEEVRAKRGLRGENRMMANGGNIFDGLSNWLPKDPNGFKGFEHYNDGNYSQGYLDYINDLSVESPIYKEALDYYEGYKGKGSGNEQLVKAEGHDNIRGGIHDIFAKGYVKQQLDDIKSSVQEMATKPVVFDDFEFEDETVEVPDLTYDEVMSGLQLPEKEGFNWSSLGQALPIISNAAKSIYNAAKPIDYSNVVAEQAYRDTPMMDLPRIGGKQVYRGIDRNRFTNPIINQGRATARDIQNTAQTAGQALASLASANYNTQRAIGEAYANADQQDLANRMQVAQFNLGIDQANANLSQTEQAYNMQRANRIAQGRIQDAATREQLQQMKGQAIDKTSNAAVQGVADLTRQNIQWDWLKKAYPEGAKAVSKNGGMLTKRKRRK